MEVPRNEHDHRYFKDVDSWVVQKLKIQYVRYLQHNCQSGLSKEESTSWHELSNSYIPWLFLPYRNPRSSVINPTIVSCCSCKVPGMISCEKCRVGMLLDSHFITTNKLHLLHVSITSRRKTPLASTFTIRADPLSRKFFCGPYRFVLTAFPQYIFSIKFIFSLY